MRASDGKKNSSRTSYLRPCDASFFSLDLPRDNGRVRIDVESRRCFGWIKGRGRWYGLTPLDFSSIGLAKDDSEKKFNDEISIFSKIVFGRGRSSKI